MFCPQCGKEVGNNAIFCKYCGSKINDDLTTETANSSNTGNLQSYSNTITCKFCGRRIPEKSVGCPYCGKIVNPRMSEQTKVDEKRVKDEPSFLWGVVGFLIPLLGVILYIIWHESYPSRSASIIKGCLLSIVLGVISTIIGVSIYFIQLKSITNVLNTVFLNF